MSLQFKKIHVCIKIVEFKASSSSSPKLSVSAVTHSEPNEEYNLRNRTVSRESKNAHARMHARKHTHTAAHRKWTINKKVETQRVKMAEKKKSDDRKQTKR